MLRTVRFLSASILATLLGLSACDSEQTGAGGSGAGGAGAGAGTPQRPEGGLPLLGSDCDPLVPTFCGLPFPSNVYLVDDESGLLPSGKRVQFGATTLPKRKLDDAHIPPELFQDHDGFSPAAAIMTHLPLASAAGCATPHNIERSLEPDSPTVLIDADTGARVPHWVDLDHSTENDGTLGTQDQRLFMIRPAVRLDGNHRYVVGIRQIQDRDGSLIAPSRVFAALRDGSMLDDGSEVERWTTFARRGLYADIFARLEGAGVLRQELQIAWDFSTASDESNTAPMLAMRDLALAAVGDLGPSFEFLSVEEFPTPADNPELLRRIEVRMTVPLYLTAATIGYDKDLPLDRLHRNTAGQITQNGTMEQDVLILVPRSVQTATLHGLLQNGHGLFGSRREGRGGYLARTANGYGYIAFATNYFGFDEDAVALASATLLGNFEGLKAVPERQIQGMVNQLLAMRMMMGRVAQTGISDSQGNLLLDPAWIDPSLRAYRGDSQGGIMGATYMAVSTDVTKGLLGEPGMAYNLLLNRSLDWPAYEALMRAGYGDDGVAAQLILGALQMSWDRSESSGFARFIEHPLPGTPAHRVLLHVARGDHQVTTYSAHLLAREIGARQLASDDASQPVFDSIFGIDEVQAPVNQGSLLVEYDFALPENPDNNLPQAQGCDPHDRVRDLTPSYVQQDAFYRTGEVIWACNGACNCDDTLSDASEEGRCRETFADQCR